MRSRLLAAALAVLWTSTAGSLAAADVTIPFTGDVTNVTGSFAAFLDGATRVEGSLVFDETVVDTNPDPSTGSFPGAMVSLSATLQGPDVTWSTSGASTLRVYDTTDQFVATALTHSVEGPGIDGYGIHNMHLILAGPNALDGDALPGSGAGFDEGNLLLDFHDDLEQTAGEASVTFTLPGPRGAGAALAAWTALALVARRKT